MTWKECVINGKACAGDCNNCDELAAYEEEEKQWAEHGNQNME